MAQSQSLSYDASQEYSYNSDYQYSSTDYDLPTIPETSQNDTNQIHSWEQLTGDTSTTSNVYQPNLSPSASSNDLTASFGFQQQTQSDFSSQAEELNSDMDYETIIRSKQLYYDPEPEIRRQKMNNNNTMVYTQNVMVRFLQPPPVEQGPLIIREIRPPQPPPPPPLVIRQRAPPQPTPPPLVLRERPPTIPRIMTAQMITRTLPPLPPPPRSVIVEKIPPPPTRPRDIIIERWIPYEAMHKRKVIVQRAEEAQSYPPPRNIIITYEPIQTRIVRQVERLDVRTEDPQNYLKMYENSLLNSDQLLQQIRQLGITEDLSPPMSNVSRSSSVEQNYAPTYENLIQQETPSISYDEEPTNLDEDLSSQFAQYGISTESIPF